MSRKKVGFNKTGIDKLPNNKPAVYTIKTDSGKLNYVGTAKRGRLQDRLQEHLGNIPGATVSVEQFNSISDAEVKEAKVIKKELPKYNKQGK